VGWAFSCPVTKNIQTKGNQSKYLLYQLPVYAGDYITEVLLGSFWLKILPLTVNYQAGIEILNCFLKNLSICKVDSVHYIRLLVGSAHLT
jgi:hypothetical protein